MANRKPPYYPSDTDETDETTEKSESLNISEKSDISTSESKSSVRMQSKGVETINTDYSDSSKPTVSKPTPTARTSYPSQRSLSNDYSEDFENDTSLSPRKTTTQVSVSTDYSDDFDTATDTQVTPRKPKLSFQHSVSVDYSDDFETDTQLSPRKSKLNLQHSVSADYSDDFETETKPTPRPRRTLSIDYSDESELETKPTPRRGKFSSMNTLSTDYSQDFETDTKFSHRQKPMLSSLHSLSNDYSDDFETDTNLSPRKVATYSSVEYSDDFETTTDAKTLPRKTRKLSRQHSVTTYDYTTDNFEETDTGITPRYKGNKHRSISFQYSEDFHSEDEAETETETESDSIRLYSPTPSAVSRIDASESSLNSEEEEAKEDFVKNLLKKLKRPKPSLRKSKQPKTTEESQDPETEERMRKYCEDKIRNLKNKGKENGGQSIATRSGSCRRALKGLQGDMDVCEHGISIGAIEKLKLENTLHNLHKAATVKVHEPYKCPHCRDKMAEVAAEEFVRKKKAIAEKQLIEHKMEKFNQQCNDPLYLMGEILKDLPHINTDRHVINQRLLRPLQEERSKQYIVPPSSTPRIPDASFVPDPEQASQEDGSASSQMPTDVPQIADVPESGRAFWRTYFSRLKEHPGKEYFNLYEDDNSVQEQ